MALEEKTFCPLGNDECQYVKDGVIYTCEALVKLKGIDTQGEEHDETRCVAGWLPILLLEISGGMMKNSSVLQNFRNDMTSQQTKYNSVLQVAFDKTMKEIKDGS